MMWDWFQLQHIHSHSHTHTHTGAICLILAALAHRYKWILQTRARKWLLIFWQFHISLFIYFRYQLMILNLLYIFKQKGTGWWQKTLKTTLADIFILPQQCFFNPLRIFRQNLNKICHLCTTNEEDKFVFIRKSRVNLPIFWSKKKRSLNNVIIY